MAGLHEVCIEIIVVGGKNIGVLRSLLDATEFGPVELVENAGWSAGMFGSVKAGLKRVRTDAAFILPVDCPLVPPAVYRTLLATPGASVVPSFQQKRGHPVLIRRELFSDILAEPDESSLRQVLARRGVVEIEVDAPEVLLDLDTPGDVVRLLVDRQGQ
jgi:molybdenum cofactor cytidylyltransferase